MICTTWGDPQKQNKQRIIIGLDRRPETKQGIKGKIVRFRSGRIRDRVRVKDKDCRSEPNTVHKQITTRDTVHRRI